eukprot:c12289_g1_i1 orf=507-662(-)
MSTGHCAFNLNPALAQSSFLAFAHFYIYTNEMLVSRTPIRNDKNRMEFNKN